MKKDDRRADMLRLRALGHLVKGNLEQARVDIGLALELHPQWESVRTAKAIIEYYSALSPAAVPDHLVQCPSPVDWVLVKRDPPSLEHMRSAAREFCRIVQDSQEDVAKRNLFEVWHLACLANDPESQESAAKYCASLLQENPGHHGVVIWAIARNFQIDFCDIQSALETKVTENRAEASDVIALLHVYLKAETPDKGLAVLDTTESVFTGNELRETWLKCRCQALLAAGKPDETLALMEANPDRGLKQMKLLASEVQARKTGNWQGVIDLFLKEYEQTQHGTMLLRCCELQAMQKNWPFVADHARRLVDAVQTPEAARLAAIGLLNAGRHQECLDLLEENRRHFTQGRFTREVQRLRIACRDALGLLPKAISDAEQVALDDPTLENLLNLVALYQKEGNLGGVVSIVRKLLTYDLSPEQALALCRAVRLEDRGLAVALWRQATAAGISDDLVTTALTVGFELGLDAQLKELMGRMQQLAHEGRCGASAWTLQQVKELMQQNQQTQAKVFASYRRGEVPVHLVAQHERIPLAYLYHGLLEDNAKTVQTQARFALFTRHGGRTIPKGFPKQQPRGRLNMDITALLLAAHLEILGKIERVFPSLGIPDCTVPALLEMRNRLVAHQPSALANKAQVVELLRQSKIKLAESVTSASLARTDLIEQVDGDWVALLEQARAQDGFVVDYLPVRNRDATGPADLRDEDLHHVTTVRTVLEALRLHGPLSQDDYDQAVSAMGVEGQKPACDPVPRAGAPLFFSGNTVESLAGSGVLQKTCDRFAVYIDRNEATWTQAAVDGAGGGDQLARWVTNLIQRLSRGIESEKYRLIPSHSTAESNSDADQHGPSMACLMTILQLEANEGDVVWVEDRHLSAYGQMGGALIVDSIEVLKALVGCGAMTRDEYFQTVHQLRSANARFLPLEPDDILFHLEQATIRDGEIVETTELHVLREYIASCLLAEGELLLVPTPRSDSRRGDEIPFIFGIAHSIGEVLAQVWKTAANPDIAVARCEWVLRSVHLRHSSLSNLTVPARTSEELSYRLSSSLALLISHGLSFPLARDDQPEGKRKQYYDWLTNRILLRRFDVEPQHIETTADILRKYLFSFSNAERADSEQRAAVRLFLQDIYVDLPEAIQEELRRDSETLSAIGINTYPVIGVDDLKFKQERFLDGARMAVNGQTATLVDMESGVEVICEPPEEESRQSGIRLRIPARKRTINLANPALGMLHESASRRENVLRDIRGILDMPEDKYTDFCTTVLATASDEERVTRVESRLKDSAVAYYGRLSMQLQNQEGFSPKDLLPPSAASVLRYLRLPDGECTEDFETVIERVAKNLLAEATLDVAITRFAGLPLPYPRCIISVFMALTPPQRHELVKRLLRSAGSPLSKVHLLHLLILCREDSPAYSRMAQRLVSRLLNADGTSDISAFCAVLRWTNDECARKHEMRRMSPALRLCIVWSHAHELYRAFISANASTQWLTDHFTHTSTHIPSEAFDRPQEYWCDASHPRHCKRLAFLAGALAYALESAPKSVMSSESKAVFSGEVLHQLPNGKVPSLLLMCEPSLAPNCLGSFLGWDRQRQLTWALGQEDARLFSEESLRDLIRLHLNQLRDKPQQPESWAVLYTAIGDAPMPDDISTQFWQLVHNTDFPALAASDPVSCAQALYLASLQVINVCEPEVVTRLREQLVSSAKAICKNEQLAAKPNSREGHIGMLVFEAALNLSVEVSDMVQSAANLAAIVEKLLSTSPAMVEQVRWAIQRFYEELPIAQAEHFARPLLLIRRSVRS